MTGNDIIIKYNDPDKSSVMAPYHYFSVHPALSGLVNLIAVMHVDFLTSPMAPVYRFPWMNNTHVFFPLAEEPLLVKSENGSEDRLHSSAYFVGPKLINDIADFGQSRHVVGITFKPGVIQRLIKVPGKAIVNIDIDATYIFGNGIREIELKLKEAKDNAAILAIVEKFLFKMFRSLNHAAPFDRAISELLEANGNITVEKFADHACKSVRQLERQSLEILGMPPRLFARLIRFGNAFSLKEVRPDLTWTSVANQLGYYDQTHLIKDFKTFMGHTPGALNLSSDASVKMMAALYGKYKTGN